MININKNGSAIVIEFTDNDKYLFNGKMEVALNELMIVLDKSNCVTFRRMTTGDIVFGQNIDKIQINGETVTKENIVDKFAAIGYGSMGSKVESVNGKTGTVVLVAGDVNAYTKEEVNALVNKMVALTQAEYDLLPTKDADTYYFIKEA